MRRIKRIDIILALLIACITLAAVAFFAYAAAAIATMR